MTDIRTKTDDEIKRVINALLPYTYHIAITRSDRHDRASAVCAVHICTGATLSFETLTQLAGACMTPAITLAGEEYGDDEGSFIAITIRWST